MNKEEFELALATVQTEDDLNALLSRAQIKSMTLNAVVTRADGKVENYGIVSGFHRNRLLNALLQTYIRIQRYIMEKKWHQF